MVRSNIHFIRSHSLSAVPQQQENREQRTPSTPDTNQHHADQTHSTLCIWTGTYHQGYLRY
eukprot:scaffold86406_cov44-Cyclotella_meneghiniana.AAC.3